MHAVYSPAHLMLTDPQGHRTGTSPGGELFKEIPGAIWRDNGESESISSMTSDPTAILSVSGYDTGRYTLMSRRADASDPPTLAAGFTRPGQVEQVSVGETASFATRPVAADDELRLDGLDGLADVLANDHNTAGAKLTVNKPPVKGTATVTADRRLRYMPAAGATGTDRLTYRLCRDGACSDAILTITLVSRDNDGTAGSIRAPSRNPAPLPRPARSPRHSDDSQRSLRLPGRWLARPSACGCVVPMPRAGSRRARSSASEERKSGPRSAPCAARSQLAERPSYASSSRPASEEPSNVDFAPVEGSPSGSWSRCVTRTVRRNGCVARCFCADLRVVAAILRRDPMR